MRASCCPGEVSHLQGTQDPWCHDTAVLIVEAMSCEPLVSQEMITLGFVIVVNQHLRGLKGDSSGTSPNRWVFLLEFFKINWNSYYEQGSCSALAQSLPQRRSSSKITKLLKKKKQPNLSDK